MEEYFQAFFILSSRRQNGMSVNPILYSDIVLYASTHLKYNFELFEHLIILMDNHYLGLKAKRSDSSKKQIVKPLPKRNVR